MNGTWYFDVVSPFAYLALRHIEDLSRRIPIVYKPVLLGVNSSTNKTANNAMMGGGVLASAFFGRAKPRLSGLLFASNVFVAAGLILTFLGLVVALRTAAENMGDAAKAQGALTILLTVASAKFLTSIGGIGASLVLRFAEHGLAKRVNAATDEICACDLQGPLGRAQPTVSHHTKALSEAGLIIGEKRGRWVWWRVVPGRLADLRAALT